MEVTSTFGVAERGGLMENFLVRRREEGEEERSLEQWCNLLEGNLDHITRDTKKGIRGGVKEMKEKRGES